jgi:hypothetical protein
MCGIFSLCYLCMVGFGYWDGYVFTGCVTHQISGVA